MDYDPERVENGWYHAAMNERVSAWCFIIDDTLMLTFKFLYRTLMNFSP